jgi:hypothetical protein
MNTFQIICKKILNMSDDFDKQLNTGLNNIFFSVFFQNKPEYSIYKKYHFYEKINTNIFLSQEYKDNFNELFYKFQKYYWVFSKLAHIYRYKKAKVIINSDLCMNTINEGDKYVFTLLQNKNKYLFNIHELIKIINSSLSHDNYYFIEPLPIKNPYNNIILNKSSLYNIYFFIRFNTLLSPDLFFYYFNVNFDINQLVKHHKNLLRNYAINNALTSDVNKLYEDILDMLDYYNNNVYKYIHYDNSSLVRMNCYQINIDNNFPKNILINVMKPYLQLYLIFKHSYLEVDKKNAKNELIYKLIKFYKYNNNFGRIIYKLTKTQIPSLTKSSKMEVEYNTNHIDFYENTKHNFLTSHDVPIKSSNLYFTVPNLYLMTTTANTTANTNTIIMDETHTNVNMYQASYLFRHNNIDVSGNHVINIINGIHTML